MHWQWTIAYSLLFDVSVRSRFVVCCSLFGIGCFCSVLLYVLHEVFVCVATICCASCAAGCVSCRSLIDVRRLLFRNCCMCLPCAVCFLSFVVFFIGCCLLFVGCRLLLVVCCVLYVG